MLAALGAARAQAPESRPADGSPRVVVRAAGEEFTSADAFELMLFHHRDEAMESLRKLAGDAVARAEAKRLGVSVDSAEVDEGVAASMAALSERLELEYGKGADLDRILAADFLTTRAEYERSVRRFVETGKLASYLVRYDALTQDRVVARHLVVVEKARAEQLLADLRAGADFAVLAKRESIAPTKNDGGKLPAFDRDYDHPLVAPAFAAEVGAVGGPVEDARGPKIVYHLYQVLERIPGRRVPFDAVRAEIAKDLKARPVERFEFDAYVRKQSKRYPAEFLGRRGDVIRPASAPASAPAPRNSPSK